MTSDYRKKFLSLKFFLDFGVQKMLLRIWIIFLTNLFTVNKQKMGTKDLKWDQPANLNFVEEFELKNQSNLLKGARVRYETKENLFIIRNSMTNWEATVDTRSRNSIDQAAFFPEFHALLSIQLLNDIPKVPLISHWGTQKSITRASCIVVIELFDLSVISFRKKNFLGEINFEGFLSNKKVATMKSGWCELIPLW